MIVIQYAKNRVVIDPHEVVYMEEILLPVEGKDEPEPFVGMTIRGGRDIILHDKSRRIMDFILKNMEHYENEDSTLSLE